MPPKDKPKVAFKKWVVWEILPAQLLYLVQGYHRFALTQGLGGHEENSERPEGGRNWPVCSFASCQREGA